jgi:hypothetical protein
MPAVNICVFEKKTHAQCFAVDHQVVHVFLALQASDNFGLLKLALLLKHFVKMVMVREF